MYMYLCALAIAQENFFKIFKIAVPEYKSYIKPVPVLLMTSWQFKRLKCIMETNK